MQFRHVVFVAVCSVAAWAVLIHTGLGQLSGQLPGKATAADAAGPANAHAGASRPAGAGQSVYFIPDIMPMLNRLGCSAVQCHGSAKLAEVGSSASKPASNPTETMASKRGLKLSMFGALPDTDYATIVKSDGGRLSAAQTLKRVCC